MGIFGKSEDEAVKAEARMDVAADEPVAMDQPKARRKGGRPKKAAAAKPRNDEAKIAREVAEAETPKEKRAALQKQFDAADEKGKAEIIAETQLRTAAMGTGF